MHFGEYELSPSLISLSPLPSAHWKAFQRLPIRSSSWCYPTFNLAKGRSLGFASTPDWPPYSDFRFRFGSTLVLNLAGKVTRRFIIKGTPSRHYDAPTACRQTGSGSISTPARGSFTFPTVLVRYRSREYLALRDGPRCFT